MIKHLFHIAMLSIIGIGGVAIYKNKKNAVYDMYSLYEKFHSMYQMMERWMVLKQRGTKIEEYFETNGFQRIAIYGMGDVGKLLLNELRKSTVDVVYAIDKNTNIGAEIQIVHPEKDFPDDVDVVVVTAIAYINEIEEDIGNKTKCPIVSIEDIIYELVYE